MRLVSGASIAALATLLAGSAEAMPTPAPYRGDSVITLAAGGCGYYWHRNVYGACVPNGPGWGGGVVVAPGYYGGYGGPGYWHGGYYHGGGVSYHYHYHYNYNYHTSYHTGGWHGGGWHGGGGHWHGGGGHWHGGGGHWHGGGHRR
jgi:hypothetical protein